MRDARDAALSRPLGPMPVHAPAKGMPRIGPPTGDAIHAGLQAQNALATAPRPQPNVSEAAIGDAPADAGDASKAAAARLSTYKAKVGAAIQQP